MPGTGYAFVSGTSMAAPMVAGAAAMLFSYDPDLSVDEVKQALMSSADHPAALSGLSVSGGRLNAAAALRAVGAVDPPPVAEPEETAPPPTSRTPTPRTTRTPTTKTSSTTAILERRVRDPTLSAVSLDGPVLVCPKKCRTKPAALKFKLSARTSVVVSLARRACPHVHDCTYRFAAKRTVKGRAGVQRMTVARTVAGMRLRAGRWRLTLAVAPPGARCTSPFAADADQAVGGRGRSPGGGLRRRPRHRALDPAPSAGEREVDVSAGGPVERQLLGGGAVVARGVGRAHHAEQLQAAAALAQ